MKEQGSETQLKRNIMLHWFRNYFRAVVNWIKITLCECKHKLRNNVFTSIHFQFCFRFSTSIMSNAGDIVLITGKRRLISIWLLTNHNHSVSRSWWFFSTWVHLFPFCLITFKDRFQIYSILWFSSHQLKRWQRFSGPTHHKTFTRTW